MKKTVKLVKKANTQAADILSRVVGIVENLHLSQTSTTKMVKTLNLQMESLTKVVKSLRKS